MALFSTGDFGKTTTARFQQPGDMVEGTIVRISEPITKKKYGRPDEVDTWGSGKPKVQVCITLDTGHRNPDDPEDDGTVGLWVLDDYSRPGNTLFPHSMLDAINNAVLAAGAGDLEIGGKLAVRFADVDPESKNPQNPRKRYQARYTPAPAAGGMFSSAPAEQPAPAPAPAPAAAPVSGPGAFVDPAPQARTDSAAQPAQAPAAAPAPAPAQQQLGDGFGLDPETARTIDVMLVNGIDVDRIVAATGATAEQVEARRPLG